MIQLVARVDGHAVLDEPILEVTARLLAEPAAKHDRLDHHHRARRAELGERRRELAGDIRPADQDDALAGGVGADRVAVRQRAQVVDPVELAAGDVQPPDVRARGHKRLVEAHLLLVGERRRATVGVELHHRHPGEGVDRLVGKKSGGRNSTSLRDSLP